ncbi:MAG: zf-HC2 domain-containing protein [Cyclobacteriaceae bacterium]|nr:zf-HC2 domain-containing protein [Cyclobacteriaceae bacterium]
MATNLLDWLRQSFSGQNDCEKCLELLELIMDGEASPEEEKLFHKHIDACLPCYETYNLEASIKKLLQTKLKRKQVPDDLIQKIRSKIRSTA